MPKSFEKFIAGREPEVLQDLSILAPWELEEKYGYSYSTIYTYEQKHKAETNAFVCPRDVSTGETCYDPCARAMFKAYGDMQGELVKAKPELERERSMRLDLEQRIHQAEQFRQKEFLQEFQALKIRV